MTYRSSSPSRLTFDKEILFSHDFFSQDYEVEIEFPLGADEITIENFDLYNLYNLDPFYMMPEKK